MKARYLVLALLALPSSAAEPNTFLLTRKGLAQIRFTLDAPLDSIVGVSDAVLGQGQFDPQTGAASGRFVADLSTFRTGISLRDQDLREEFFEVSKYPTAVLQIHKVERKASGPLVP